MKLWYYVHDVSVFHSFLLYSQKKTLPEDTWNAERVCVSPVQPTTTAGGANVEAISLEIKYHEVVGNGTFGLVYRASIMSSSDDKTSDKFPNGVCAIKKIKKINNYDNAREIQIYRALSHNNIVGCHYWFEYDDLKSGFVSLVMEYMPTDLSRYIRWAATRQPVEPIPELTLAAVVFQSLNALRHTHRLGLCHRDIKPHNILLDTATLQVKLCDFGSAKFLGPGVPSNTYIGSRVYRAPELLFNNDNYTCAIDIWGLGCVLGQLIKLGSLFNGSDSLELMECILHVVGTPPPTDLSSLCPEFDFTKLPKLKSTLPDLCCNYKPFIKNLLCLMLTLSPTKRPSAVQLLNSRRFMDYFVNGALNNKDTPFASTFLQLSAVARDIYQEIESSFPSSSASCSQA